MLLARLRLQGDSSTERLGDRGTGGRGGSGDRGTGVKKYCTVQYSTEYGVLRTVLHVERGGVRRGQKSNDGGK